MRNVKAIALVGLIVFATTGYAEDPAELIQSGADFLSKGKYAKAVEDLQWAIREIRMLQAEELKGFLPKEVSGYDAYDEETDAGAAAILNINLIEAGRRFEATGENEIVTLKIMAGEMGGTGLGAMMKMAQMYGGQSGELIRVNGHKGTVEWEDGSNGGKLTMVLDNDIQVTVEISEGNKDNLKTFAGLIDLDGLEALSN